MAEHDSDHTESAAFRLSEEQAAEVRRRLAESNPETMTLEEFNEHSKRRYGI